MEKVKKNVGMNPKIKERIEKIHRGIVPEGYRETKIGVIPNDWELIQLGNLGEIFRGKGIPRSKLVEKGVPCILYGELYTKFNNVIELINSRTDKETAKDSFRLEYGDILFTGSGEKAEEIGKAAMYLGEDESAYAGGDLVILRPKDEIKNKVYGYLLNANYVNKQKYKKAQGHSVVHIYGDNIKKLYVPFIPVDEQQKIADILSTWDRAIELKESLIKEKEEQKKGLMGQIFSKIDKFTFVGDLIKESKIVEKSPTVEKLLTVRLHLEGISKRELRGNETVGATTLYQRKSGQFIYGKQNFHNGALSIVPKSLDGFLSSSDIPSFDFNHNKVNPLYFYYYWSRESQYRRLEAYTTGTGSKRLNPKEFYNIKMELPNLNKQNLIAKTLVNFDKQISLLKQEVELLKEQKKGLMQLLLTGIIRVGEVD